MVAFLGSPSIISPPLKRLHLSSSFQEPRTPPPPPSNQEPPSPPALPSSQTLQATPLATPSSSLPIEPKQRSRAAAATSAPPESTDWIASSLSRRFGLGAGLAWAGFLAIGVLSEQIKTRLEASRQEADTRDVEKEQEVLLPNGIKYYEMRVGGGASPVPGDLVVIDLKGMVEGSGEVFVDTFGGAGAGAGGGKPLALVLGSRPYTGGVCEGVESALRLMKAGGKARVVVPPRLGFGDKGADLGSGVQIPPGSTLEFIVQVDKVSIAPS